MAKKRKNQSDTNLIVANRKARHDFEILETLQAGISLEGWEVKALRAGRCQLIDSYVTLRRGEAWVLGMHVTPLASASTHTIIDPTRSRKLLLQAKELDKLSGVIQRKGLTVVALALTWQKNWVKVTLGIARGRKQHDKREMLKARDCERQLRQVGRRSM